jgi:hypothetical protein
MLDVYYQIRLTLYFSKLNLKKLYKKLEINQNILNDKYNKYEMAKIMAKDDKFTALFLLSKKEYTKQLEIVNIIKRVIEQKENKN